MIKIILLFAFLFIAAQANAAQIDHVTYPCGDGFPARNDIPGYVTKEIREAWYFYEDNGFCYLILYIMCDGLIVQVVPEHGDVQKEISVIGQVPNIDIPFTVDDYIYQYNRHIIIRVYQNGVQTVFIQWPNPNGGSGSINTIQPALVSYS